MARIRKNLAEVKNSINNSNSIGVYNSLMLDLVDQVQKCVDTDEYVKTILAIARVQSMLDRVGGYNEADDFEREATDYVNEKLAAIKELEEKFYIEYSDLHDEEIDE